MPHSSASSPWLRLSVALAPTVLCLAFGWAVAAGPLGFGGGEKDIFLVMPLALWALVFALASLVQWALGVSLRRASGVAALVGLGVVVAAFAALLLASAGR